MQIPIKAVLQHYKTGASSYKIQSPFLSELLHFLKKTEKHNPQFAKIEDQRNILLNSKQSIYRKDFGAGSKNTQSNKRKVLEIAKTDLSSSSQCRELYALANFSKAKRILEFGTSLGIASAYLASVGSVIELDTVEADENLVKIATGVAENLQLSNIHFHNQIFTDFLKTIKGTYDIIYLDGHHTYAHSIAYANQLLSYLNPYSFLIVDDIYWSADMYRAWTELRYKDDWQASIAFHNYGILIKNSELIERIHINYVPTWSKPWQLRFSI